MTAEAGNIGRYRVSGLTIDLGTCTVIHENHEIELPRLSFDLLVTLIRHSPNVVTFDSLIEEVWDGRVVAEETVTQRVKLLRDALAEAGFTNELVSTARGRGYRLAAPVNVESEVQGRFQPRMVAVAASLVILVVAAGFYVWMHATSSYDPGEHSIAVLPFDDLTQDKQAGYLGDGIAEELLNRLAQIPGLHVTSRTSSFAVRDDEDVRSIAEKLGVRTVLEGSVRMADDKVRVTVQLIDTVEDKHVWSEQFDRELADVFEIQDEVAIAIAERFRLATQAVAPTSRQLDPGAVELYLQARRDIRSRSAPKLAAAVDSLETIVNMEPAYAPAWVALAQGYIELSRRGNYPMHESDSRAGDALRVALQIDSELPEAHATLGLLRMSTGDGDGAYTALQQATILNPNLADAHLWLGHLLRGGNRFEEARMSYERAAMLDPLNLAVNDALTFEVMAAGDYDAGIRHFERRLRIEPKSAETYRLMAISARTFGRLVDAVNYARRAVAIDPGSPLNLSELAMAYSAIGELDMALELTEAAGDVAPDNHWVAMLRAFTFINRKEISNLNNFAEIQLELVDPDGDSILSAADRVRLAIGGLASSFAQDFEKAESRIERALGASPTSVLEVQFTIGLLGALAYAYDQNGKPDRAERTRLLCMDLIDKQQDWASQHLIYPDSIASIQLMRGDETAALETMRRAIANGWTGHRGFLYGAQWQQFYEDNDEFRALMDMLADAIADMRQELARLTRREAALAT